MKVEKECHSCGNKEPPCDWMRCDKCGKYSCFGTTEPWSGKGRCHLGCKFKGDCEKEQDRWDKLFLEHMDKMGVQVDTQLGPWAREDFEEPLREANS